jgi:hypothetical protein
VLARHTALCGHLTCRANLTARCGLLQRFLDYDEDGNERAHPYSGQLTDDDGPKQAVLFIQWLGKNMPGWDYPLKAPQLVRRSSRQAY